MLTKYLNFSSKENKLSKSVYFYIIPQQSKDNSLRKESGLSKTRILKSESQTPKNEILNIGKKPIKISVNLTNKLLTPKQMNSNFLNFTKRSANIQNIVFTSLLNTNKTVCTPHDTPSNKKIIFEKLNISKSSPKKSNMTTSKTINNFKKELHHTSKLNSVFVKTNSNESAKNSTSTNMNIPISKTVSFKSPNATRYEDKPKNRTDQSYSKSKRKDLSFIRTNNNFNPLLKSYNGNGNNIGKGNAPLNLKLFTTNKLCKYENILKSTCTTTKHKPINLHLNFSDLNNTLTSNKILLTNPSPEKKSSHVSKQNSLNNVTSIKSTISKNYIPKSKAPIPANLSETAQSKSSSLSLEGVMKKYILNNNEKEELKKVKEIYFLGEIPYCYNNNSPEKSTKLKSISRSKVSKDLINAFDKTEETNDFNICNTDINDTEGNKPEPYDDDQGNYNIRLGDHINYRYEIISELGKGSFGQAIKCYDHKTKERVCIKIIKNKKKFNNQAKIEINLLEYIKDNDTKEEANVVKIIDKFTFRSHIVYKYIIYSV